jgi:small subunit ribosomal protein S16
MSTKIRLTRLGGHKRPYYRIVVTNARNPRDGRAIENLGYYDPLAPEKQISLDIERMKVWLDQGAVPSETVKQLLVKAASPQG